MVAQAVPPGGSACGFPARAQTLNLNSSGSGSLSREASMTTQIFGYSLRNTMAGSMRAARKAGMSTAVMAVTIKTAAAAA